jgi:hypothetical protein
VQASGCLEPTLGPNEALDRASQHEEVGLFVRGCATEARLRLMAAFRPFQR